MIKTAEEIVTEKKMGLISISSGMTISDAIQVMLQNRIGAIFIKENEEIIGVWSERDLISNVTDNTFDPQSAKINDYMVTDLHTAPHTDTTYSLMEKFRSLRIRHLLIEKFGKIIGLISPGDIMADKNKEIEALNRELENNIEELNEANQHIKLSEEKYKRLVEGSNDYIFTLDENGCFLTANKALLNLFKIELDDIKSRKFIELLYARDEDEKSLTKRIILKKLLLLIEKRKPVQFIAEFKSVKIIEPIQMVVRLEVIDIEGKNEILGKASDIMVDELLQYFLYEKRKFSIGNSLLTAEEVTRRITHNLHKFLPQTKINLLRLALREIIINAIEHGNLNITFEEKSKSMIDGTYLNLLNERRNNPHYKNKKVLIEYLIHEGKAVYKIEDEGDGFDHENTIANSLKAANEGALAHGRGIALANDIFEEVRYNKKGNQVLLSIQL